MSHVPQSLTATSSHALSSFPHVGAWVAAAGAEGGGGEGGKGGEVAFFHECIFPCYLRRSGRPTQAVILPSTGKQDEALTLLWRRKNLLSACRHCTRMSEFPHWSWPVCERDHGATYPTIVRSHICRACVGERETSSTQGQTAS